MNEKKEKIKEFLMNELIYPECYDCRYYDTDVEIDEDGEEYNPCSGCNPKYINWKIGRNYAEQLVNEIMEIVNSQKQN